MDASSGIHGLATLEAVTAPAGGITGLAHVTSNFDDRSIASPKDLVALTCANDGPRAESARHSHVASSSADKIHLDWLIRHKSFQDNFLNQSTQGLGISSSSLFIILQ
ncbi:hypothetical protein KBZ15_05105 [Cyanobium sp. BA20m-p-22]|uniref:hypothetical protein n=1 Tax=Cyanobium sp. BA20m-p-22 TaxID=2823704 RepID=UPI0020CD23F9|nr:hypothetical protein [Cyanobium sp. BA20m-p-22]MCP9909294.1 hypothetical protein [Cyanobium sp. BA20m-p-22]